VLGAMSSGPGMLTLGEMQVIQEVQASSPAQPVAPHDRSSSNRL
jgi:hypothetical protein